MYISTRKMLYLSRWRDRRRRRDGRWVGLRRWRHEPGSGSRTHGVAGRRLRRARTVHVRGVGRRVHRMARVWQERRVSTGYGRESRRGRRWRRRHSVACPPRSVARVRTRRRRQEFGRHTPGRRHWRIQVAQLPQLPQLGQRLAGEARRDHRTCCWQTNNSVMILIILLKIYIHTYMNAVSFSFINKSNEQYLIVNVVNGTVNYDIVTYLACSNTVTIQTKPIK